MTSSDHWESSEYAPPLTVKKKGLPVLTAEQMASLRRMGARIPTDQRPIIGFEAAMALWFEAPRHAFRETADGPRVERNALLATSEAELDTVVRTLNTKFVQLLSQRSPVRLRGLTASDAPLTIILDDRRLTEWSPLAVAEDGSFQLHWGGLILSPSVI